MINPMSQEIRVDQEKSPRALHEKCSVFTPLSFCYRSFNPSDSVDAFTGTSVGVQRLLKIRNIQTENSTVRETHFSQDGTSHKASNMLTLYKSDGGVETKIKL